MDGRRGPRRVAASARALRARGRRLDPGEARPPGGHLASGCVGDEGSLALNVPLGRARRRADRRDPPRTDRTPDVELAGVPPVGADKPEVMRAYLDARFSEAVQVLSNIDSARDLRRIVEKLARELRRTRSSPSSTAGGAITDLGGSGAACSADGKDQAARRTRGGLVREQRRHDEREDPPRLPRRRLRRRSNRHGRSHGRAAPGGRSRRFASPRPRARTGRRGDRCEAERSWPTVLGGVHLAGSSTDDAVVGELLHARSRVRMDHRRRVRRWPLDAVVVADRVARGIRAPFPPLGVMIVLSSASDGG